MKIETIQFLWPELSPRRIKPLKSYPKVIKTFRWPKTMEELQSFLYWEMDRQHVYTHRSIYRITMTQTAETGEYNKILVCYVKDKPRIYSKGSNGQAMKPNWKRDILDYLMMYDSTPLWTTGITSSELFFQSQFRYKIQAMLVVENQISDEQFRDKGTAQNVKARGKVMVLKILFI